MDIMKEIGESLKEIRETKKYSVYKIEKETGIKHQSLYKWEKGEQEPSIIACIKLAEYYEVTLDYLVGKEDKNIKSSKYYMCQINANGNNNL